MFKWMKDRLGCRACYVSKTPCACEKYMLSVAGIWTATVQSLHCEHQPGVLTWEGWLYFGDTRVSGQSGGESDRDFHMTWLEERIRGYIQQLEDIRTKPGRRILDALVHTDGLGNWYHPVLESSDGVPPGTEERV